MDSTDDVCAFVSVQPVSCPVSDTEAEIRGSSHGGSFQSMLNIASFNINKFSGEGLYVVFVVLEEDICHGNSVPQSINRSKSFTFRIDDDVSRKEIAWQVVVSTLVMTLLCAGTVAVTCLYSVYAKKINRKNCGSAQSTEEGVHDQGDDDTGDRDDGDSATPGAIIAQRTVSVRSGSSNIVIASSSST